ncbi:MULTISPECIES: pimeloyl-ACP methyl ester esterase BioH [unclassified Pseudoxanthomonas]|uniref:pimeloyl-ACP methyl ester esterase BioH n=1 Tax=unclassified Pseudoxanthomonas TaxID=2645906 RepID=UPI0008EECBD1|nr:MULTISPECIES: pimeloyl-ACP methyl ester esterase BioH [unclassified Pseudoxanthomonas]PPJ41734.1 pimeloyl-[acyl-carrier protein] methyl ester esterase [Pseudoxanthomonas sp. KAs_5_3]SFV31955.1 carboxylesterase BioH (pimeloyl-CoA synthesis) [Pseudoxanthomonas sp. YR558]
MHIETTGSGPSLVLLHGWALHGGVFAPLVQRLSDRYTLHLVDLPGHGHSRDSDIPLSLDATVDALLARTPPAAWLAWSLGGLFALHAAARSSQVRGLAMMASTPRFVRSEDWPYAVDAQVFGQFGDDLRNDYAGTLERFLALDTMGSEHARSELRTLKRDVYARGEPTPSALQEGLRLLEQSDLRAALPDIRVPSLWIAGRRDLLVPAKAMRAASESAFDGRYVEISGGGHAPFLGHADLVVDALDAFLPTLEAAQ